MALRLFLLRWLSIAILGLPGLLGAAYAIGDSGGRSPFFTEAPRPMPLMELVYWVRQVPGLAWGALAASGLAVWLVGLFLTAGAAEILRRDAAARPSVWRAMVDAGSRALFPNLRIAAAALVAIGAMSAALRFAARRLSDHAVVASWTGQTLLYVSAGRFATLLVWAAFIGALAFWCHVIVAADRRRLVRRMVTLVPGVVRRRPLRALLAQMGVGALSQLIGGVTLGLWAQSRHAAPLVWLALWGAALAAQSALWLWRVRACCLTWASSELDDLRAAPDEPWHAFRRLRSHLRRRLLRAPAA